MRIRVKTVPLIGILLVEAALALSVPTFRLEAQAQSGVPSATAKPFWERINEKAEAARSGDASSVDALTDEILSPHVLPLEIARSAVIKSRLVRAELNFRTSRGRGIPEVNVVKVIHRLASRFGAPEYAFTSRYEVRKLRVALLASSPQLILGKPSPTSSGASALSLSAEMSPLEASYVIAMLIQQKLYNPDYQLTY